jgi:hypothetical protein
MEIGGASRYSSTNSANFTAFNCHTSHSPVPTAALALSFSMVLFLIADLDRPDSGLVTSDQSPMLELNKRLQQLADQETGE